MVTSFATISSSFAWLPEQQSPPSVVLWFCVGSSTVWVLLEPGNRFSFDSGYS